ncbi:MAG: PDZ domain-containing protein [Acidobacteriia bacterium]|nr:PDZ domain-containing protein [Terriglobia bacterium]
MGVFPGRLCRFLFLLITFLFGSTLSAADSIHYRLAMPQPSSHFFVVTIIVEQVAAPALDFQMPAWSPGRYVIYDFAHNVQEFRAQGDQNKPLAFEKIDKQTWRVHTGGSQRVAIEYKVFANTLSGTFSQLNDQHANYNGASIYMYVVGLKDHPIDLDIEAPDGWAVMNGLPGGKGDGNHWMLRAPNYDVLIDCPTEIAPFSDSGSVRMKSFSFAGKSFRVVIHNNGSDKNVDRFVSDLEKIVKTEFEVMGPPDYNQYTFLFHFNPYALHGDGMEHLNSTQIVITGNLGDDENYDNYLWVSAHEFFHCWNVKRLRPVALGPWDYAGENYTPSLWISEGITSYYASLSLRRAGIWDDQKYFKHVARLIEMIQNSPGRFERNVEQASLDTWFWHDTPDVSNWQNVFLSYYTQGEILGALLDLEIRQRTANAKTLDDVFRTLYKKFYETPGTTYYLQGRGFREEDFLEALSHVSSTDFADFWKQNIATTAEVDYNRYLKAAGLFLDAQHSQAEPYAGISSGENPNHLVVIENIIPESPAAHAGLSAGDTILAVDEERVSLKTLGEILKEKKSGEKVKFTVYRENRLLNVDVVLGSHEEVTYSIKELNNPTELQTQIRASWLGRPSDLKGSNRP